MLTDIQIKDLAKKMDIPLVFCGFKDELATEKLQYNKSYIINLEDEFDDKGNQNEGTHWICGQVNKYPNGKIERIFFDSYGAPPAEEIKKFLGQGHYVPYNKKDIQSLMNGACGWYALAFLHYINSFEGRTNDLYSDVEDFLSLFNDLNVSCDFKANEYMLKQFFRSKDASKRTPVEVFADPNSISSEDKKGGDIHQLQVDVKYV